MEAEIASDDKMSLISGNPIVMTFPIKKRINTELLINRKQKGDERIGSIKILDLLEEGKTEMTRKVNAGMKTAAAMTYITWKERQTNSSLFEKTMSLRREKNMEAQKVGCLSKYYNTQNQFCLKMNF